MPLRAVALCARSQSIHFMIALARRLKEGYGAQIHLYCSGPQEVVTYESYNGDGLFTSITSASTLNTACFAENLSESEVIARARRFENLIGCTINRLMLPDRHFGRGYCLAGYYHPRSRYSEQTSYIQAVHAFSEALAFWQREFEQKRITLCLNGTREAAHMARAAAIPYRVLVASRFRNYHCWAQNEFYENADFEKRWHEIEDGGDIEMDQPYLGHLASRQVHMKQFSIVHLVKQVSLTLLRYAYWNLRGYSKAKGYYLSNTIRYHVRLWTEYRRLDTLSKAKLTDLSGKRFVYFPLHVEPETALHGLSPEYFYQHALIAAVCRDLPAGVYLAVKEAYGCIGRRPTNFYRQIADMKNVVLLNCWERGIECAQKADAVVTICGTAGLEAAVAGTPVIAFGHHNLYNFLPSVRVVHDERFLREYLHQALFDNAIRTQTKSDGRRLLRAIADCSFDMEQFDYIDQNKFSSHAVEAACQALAKSLMRGKQAADSTLEPA